MTTTTRSPAVRAARARWARRRNRLIGYGLWQPFADAAPVRAHVKAIQATGMSLNNLSTASGVTRKTLGYLMYGDELRPTPARIRTEAANTLLAYWPHLDDYVDGAVIDSTGTRRRLQALAAAGWSDKVIHRHIDFVNYATIGRGRSGTHVTARFARAVRDLYQWASAARPEDHGVEAWIAERGRRRAQSANWAGAAAWDDDTIDDPAAQPDWTGHCGTDHGWWVHSVNQLPPCPRCTAAHEQWKTDHRPLGRRAYVAALQAARAAASNRGAVIAADARELAAQGVERERIAERLGVSVNHLQQELCRHPEQGLAA